MQLKIKTWYKIVLSHSFADWNKILPDGVNSILCNIKEPQYTDIADNRSWV